MSHAQPPEAGRHPCDPPVVMAFLTAFALLVAMAAPAWAADPARGRQWALNTIGADAGHAVGQGAGMVIAVVDSGVDLVHEDLADRLVAGYDVVDDDPDPQDEYGHGTHVAGIAAATGENGRGVLGTAPRARIMPVRVLDEEGTGSGEDVEAGIRWAVDHGAHVVNLSLGEATQGVVGSSLTEAVRYAWQNGVVVVVAAGNDFVLSSGFGDEPALVVSATTREDTKPGYSNGVGQAEWGMAAPGGGCALLAGCSREDGVLSTYWVRGSSDQYAYQQGTSMAAPHVAGAAAILRSLGLSPRETVDRLLATAEDVGPSGRDGTFGAGRLDLAAAVGGLGGDAPAASSAPSPRAASPEPSPAPAQQTSSPAPTAEPTTTSPAPSPTAPSPTPAATPSAAAVPERSPGPSDGPATTPPEEPLSAADDTDPDPTDTDPAGALPRLAATVLFVAAVAALFAAHRVGRAR